MNRNQVIALIQVAVLGSGLVVGGASAVHGDVSLDGIKMTYHGGRLIEHVKVVPLLLGSSWVRKNTPTYLKNFFQALFTDGRYMANVAQYSAGGYQIGNGSAVDPVVDLKVLGKVDAAHAANGIRYQINDDQIQAEIKAQITAGKLPKPDADTLYMVCFQYDVVVVVGNADSETGIGGYHGFNADFGAAYAVACPTFFGPSLPLPNSPTGYTDTYFNRNMTSAISHEMAEVVTDPEPDPNGGGGWYTDGVGIFGYGRGEEIGDIPATLNNLGFITDDQFFDVLTGPDGTKYAVQKIWSIKDKTPVAFAASSP